MDSAASLSHHAGMYKDIKTLVAELKANLGNINQEKLAELVGVSQATVSRWGFAMRPESLRDVAEAYAVRVDDDSMAERFIHGNLLQIDPTRPVRPGDNVVLQLKDGQCFVKILVRRTERATICRQLNPEQNIEFKASEVDKIHLVVGVDYLER